MTGNRPGPEMFKAKYKDFLGMAWVLAGKEVLLLLGGEYEYHLERHSWPEDHLLAKGELTEYEAGVEVVASTNAPYGAILTWWDGGSEFEIVNLRTLLPVPSTKFASNSSANILYRLVFSPDDRLVVAIFQITPKDADTAGKAIVGSVVIGSVGEWDYLEIPLLVDLPPGTDVKDLDWSAFDDVQVVSFTDKGVLTLKMHDNHTMTLDIESLRADPQWLTERDRRRQAEKQEREEEVALLNSIRDYNQRAFEMSKQLGSEGLTCPWCKRHGRDIRYHPGLGERALFICPGCGRSFGPDSKP